THTHGANRPAISSSLSVRNHYESTRSPLRTNSRPTGCSAVSRSACRHASFRPAGAVCNVMKLRNSAFITGLVAVVAALAAIRPPAVIHQRASLSDDLVKFEQSHSSRAVRVIAHGTRGQLQAISQKDGVPIVKFLDDEAVFTATRTQLETLAGEPSIHHLSGDLKVGDF